MAFTYPMTHVSKQNFIINELPKYFIYTTSLQCHSSAEISGLQLLYIALRSSPANVSYNVFLARRTTKRQQEHYIRTPLPHAHIVYAAILFSVARDLAHQYTCSPSSIPAIRVYDCTLHLRSAYFLIYC